MNKFFLNLGFQPLANNYLIKFRKSQIKYNLKLFFNTKTKMVSISKRIPSEKMFTNNYPYRSSLSKTMRDSFYKLSLEIKKKFNPKIILEIGSNDGALIKNFDNQVAIGVEPCRNLSLITKRMGFITYNKYWNFDLANKIKSKFKNIDVIYSANTLTHISNLNEVFKSISFILSDKGILIIEDPSLLECLKKNSYDQFYNEHIYLFSALSVQKLLKKFNLEIFDIKSLETHGGSIRYYIKKISNKKLTISNNVKKQIIKEKKYGLHKYSTYKKFSKNVQISKIKLLNMLNGLKNKKQKVIGYGSTAKAVTILNFCNINEDLICNFVDTTPEKINRYMPGKNIKILKYNNKILKKYYYVFLGAWNFKKEIMHKEKVFLKKGGKFITHVTSPHFIK
jgi:SAM-dependent methyltransferase